MARVNYGYPLLSEAVNQIIDGRAKLLRAIAAMDAASNAGTVPANLEVAPFSAATSQGAGLWTTAGSVAGLLTAADPGGLAQFLADLDNG